MDYKAGFFSLNKRMKRILLSLAVCLVTIGASAQWKSANLSNGYYRVMNSVSKRYMALLDNQGHASYDRGGVDADLYAIRTLADNSDNKITSNPATVVYVKKINGGYSCEAQGTSSEKLTSYAFLITQRGTDYRFSAEKPGVARVVLNEEDQYDMKGKVMADSGSLKTSGRDRREWKITPISSSSNNYFGFSPTIEANGKYYQTFYADFSFKIASSGVKAYYVYSLWDHKAVLKEFAEGDVVPAATPLLIECSSKNSADNKVDIVLPGTQTATVEHNQLSGIYFKYEIIGVSPEHHNFTPYDPVHMRVLRVGADGKPVFKKVSDLEYLPANKAYLTVPADYPDEISVMSFSDFTAGVKNVKVDKKVNDDVYTLNGVKVENTTNLPHGVYIIGGKKVVK